jgi:hypothetical protein
MNHRPAILFSVLAALVIGATTAYDATAFPEPAIVSPSWMLDFTFKKPQPLAARDRQGRVRWYWYMPYKVVNNTGEDRLFIPEITIATDSGKIINAGQKVPASIFDQVKGSLLKNPLLENPMEIVGKILQGEDYAREGVAIWPAFDHDVDEFVVFFAGHSGENATVRNPVTNEEVLMRRTIMLRFRSPGNHPTPERQPIILEQHTEVMR